LSHIQALSKGNTIFSTCPFMTIPLALLLFSLASFFFSFFSVLYHYSSSVAMLIPRSTNCAAPHPRSGNQYGYTPGLAIGIIFCALFGLSTLVHVYQTHRYRSWWTYVFVVGALSKHPTVLPQHCLDLPTNTSPVKRKP
jgi:hypothetical protein